MHFHPVADWWCARATPYVSIIISRLERWVLGLRTLRTFAEEVEAKEEDDDAESN